jgi:hypothetical protein
MKAARIMDEEKVVKKAMRSIPGKYLPLREVQKLGFSALVEKIGLADTMRFLGQFESGSGDYTRERREILAGISGGEFYKRARKIAR